MVEMEDQSLYDCFLDHGQQTHQDHPIPPSEYLPLEFQPLYQPEIQSVTSQTEGEALSL